MRTKGKLRTWNDEKGFGFIESGGGGKDVFLHISAFRNCGRRPEAGQYVTYTLSTDDRGRSRADEATLPGYRKPRPRMSGAAGAVLISGGFLALLALSALMHKLPALVLWVYLAISLITFMLYSFDKAAAKDGARRTPESTLHWFSVAGGWPGALIAQQVLRHKSKKKSFRTVFWVTVIINCGILGWMYTPGGVESVQAFFT